VAPLPVAPLPVAPPPVRSITPVVGFFLEPHRAGDANQFALCGYQSRHRCPRSPGARVRLQRLKGELKEAMHPIDIVRE